MTLPCCQATVHTLCGIKIFGAQLINAFTAYCSCGSVQYTSLSDEEAASLPDTPVFTQAVKSCNRFRILASKASGKMKKLLRERKKVFAEQTTHHIQAIKAIKKIELSSIRSNDIYKAYNKAQTAYKKSYNKIIKDFSLTTFSYRRKLRLRLRDIHRISQVTGPMLLRYPFRVRI